MDYPVGFPLSGNPQTSETPSPLLHPSPSTNGSSLSQNAQTSGTPSPLQHPSPCTNGIPLFQNAQSSGSTTNPPASGIGPPAIFTPEEMHEELGRMPFDDRFFHYMRQGRCRDYFNGWYMCNLRVVYNNEDTECCYWLAGVLRDCMFENSDHYGPLLSLFRRRTGR